MLWTSRYWVIENPNMFTSLASSAGGGNGIEMGQSAPHTGRGVGMMTSW